MTHLPWYCISGSIGPFTSPHRLRGQTCTDQCRSWGIVSWHRFSHLFYPTRQRLLHLYSTKSKKYQKVRTSYQKIDLAMGSTFRIQAKRSSYQIYLLAKNANFCVASRASVSVLFGFCLAQSDFFFCLLCWSCRCSLATSLRVPLGRWPLIHLTSWSTLITLHTILACEFVLHISHVLLEIGSIAGLWLHLLLVLGCRWTSCLVWNVGESLLLHLLMRYSDGLHLGSDAVFQLLLL